jgi:hypothetical protein
MIELSHLLFLSFRQITLMTRCVAESFSLLLYRAMFSFVLVLKHCMRIDEICTPRIAERESHAWNIHQRLNGIIVTNQQLIS